MNSRALEMTAEDRRYNVNNKNRHEWAIQAGNCLFRPGAASSPARSRCMPLGIGCADPSSLPPPAVWRRQASGDKDRPLQIGLNQAADSSGW